MTRRLLKRMLVFAAALLAGANAVIPAHAGELDFFLGAQFNFRDINYNNRVFDVLVNLTPGVKWRFGDRWEVAAQALVPVVNQYGERYSHVRLNVASVSKQFGFFGRWRMKVSAGWFAYERYGLDIKNMVVINDWLAMTAQLGLTGYCSMAYGLEGSAPERITAIAGPEFYLHKWNTQFSLRGGRFVYEDYGVVAEAMRHFKHVSVSVYASYSNIGRENAGFRIVAMLPPYTRKKRKVNFRPASNFRLTYSMEADSYANYNYMTDPEENEREGWFDHDLIPWGPDSAFSDFKYVEPAPKAKKVKK